jgi:hypothetical protein
MGEYYILDKHKNAIECDLQTWATMFKDIFQRIVQKTWINDVEVSTVFLGSNHRYDKLGPPLIFESMIFGGDHNDHQDRYSTYEESRLGHWSLVSNILSEGYVDKLGMSINIIEKQKVGISYYTVGYGTCMKYHTSLLELYDKTYESTPKPYISDAAYLGRFDQSQYDICVDGTPDDLQKVVQNLIDLAWIYPFDKWIEAHQEES